MSRKEKVFDQKGHSALGMCISIGVLVGYVFGGSNSTNATVAGGFIGLAIFIGWAVNDHFEWVRVALSGDLEAARINAEEADEREAAA